jgi:DNA-binding NarL/FixJ family response regulator
MSEVRSQELSGEPGCVMVVEDDRLVAVHLESMLTSFGFRLCPGAQSAEGALKTAEEHMPDVVLMDIRLEGDLDGIAAAKLLRERLAIGVVFLTAEADLATVERAKETQPYGYLLKPVRALDLRFCLELALHAARNARISRTQLLASTLALPGPDKPDQRDDRLSTLSAREIEVLTLLARGHTSRSIAQVLNIAKPTVDTYRRRLAEKLGARSRSDLVAIAARAGLL